LGDDPSSQRLAGGFRLGSYILAGVPYLIFGGTALWLWLRSRKIRTVEEGGGDEA
jgi:hypothetical protein